MIENPSHTKIKSIFNSIIPSPFFLVHPPPTIRSTVFILKKNFKIKKNSHCHFTAILLKFSPSFLTLFLFVLFVLFVVNTLPDF